MFRTHILHAAHGRNQYRTTVPQHRGGISDFARSPALARIENNSRGVQLCIGILQQRHQAESHQQALAMC